MTALRLRSSLMPVVLIEIARMHAGGIPITAPVLAKRCNNKRREVTRSRARLVKRGLLTESYELTQDGWDTLKSFRANGPLKTIIRKTYEAEIPYLKHAIAQAVVAVADGDQEAARAIFGDVLSHCGIEDAEMARQFLRSSGAQTWTR